MDEDALIAKIAHMYYVQNMDLKEIGEAFNVSYATISRLLKKGREKKIIRILISPNFERLISLESELKSRFNLKEVFSVNVENNFSYDIVLNLVGAEAANYLAGKLRDGDVLGISWGRTIYNVVNNFRVSRRMKVDLVQLQGHLPAYDFELSSFDLVRRLKTMFTGNYYFINSDAVVDSPETKRILINNSSIKNTIELFKSINIALTSVGLYDADNLILKNQIRPDEKEELDKYNLVGVNLFIFFDIEGNIYEGKINRRVISIGAEELFKVENKILVVAGKEKVPAIIGALRAKLADIVFIDSITLEEVLMQLD